MNQTTITESALRARAKRKLAPDGKRLLKMRPGTPYAEYRYVCVDEQNHICSPSGDDLEAIGREMGVLRAGEVLAV